MKVRRFLAGFLLGWLVIGTVIFFASDGWAGAGLTGVVIGIALGWFNVDRGEDSWKDYIRERVGPWL